MGVQRAISQLRDSLRVVTVLRDLKGLSYQEITQLTGWSAGTVKSKLHRARRELRRIINASVYEGAYTA